MAGASAWVFYNDFKVNLGRKLLDMENDLFKIALFSSASNAGSRTTTPANYGNFAANGHEVPSGNGYLTGGTIAGSPSWTGGGVLSTANFDTADVQWTGVGAGFTARFAVLYDDSAPSKEAVAFSVLDSAPADVVVDSGNTLTVQIIGIIALS